MKAPLWVVVWILVIELFLILVFVPGQWTEKVIIKEAQKIERALGTDSVEWIRDRADSWYNTTMIDSGVYRTLYTVMIPTKRERENSRGMETLGSALWPGVEGRLTALMHVIYQVYARVALFLVWAPYMLILLVPSIWDGMMSWRIKRTNFDYASPIFHRYGVRGVIMITQIMLITFFMPIALSPLFIPLAMMGTSVMIGLTVANFQKRV